MKYEIVEIPEFKIIGRSKTFVFDEFVKQGPVFWKDYVGSDHYKKLYRMNNCMPGTVTNAPLLSAYFPKEDSNTHEFTDVLGIEFDSEFNSEGFDMHTVPSSTYAQFDCIYKTSMKTNRYIYGDWFTSNGFARDGNKPDIVSYFPVPFRPVGEMRVRWWIPVEVT